MIDISRRDFLKGLAASALALGLDPYRGIAVTDDFYQNRRLNLSFRKPQGWEFDSVADFVALREQQVLLSQNSQETHPLKDPDNLPVVIAADPKYRQGDFAPAIMLWDEPLGHPNPSEMSQEIFSHRAMIQGFARSYQAVKTKEQPQALMVRGAKGTRSCWSYRHELEGGQSYLLQVTTLLFFRFPRVHTCYLIDSYQRSYISPATIDEFIHTIHYE